MDAGSSRTFTVDQARQLLAEIRPDLDALIAVRADLAELTYALESGGSAPAGGIPERKALEAAFAEGVEAIARHGIHLKGVAPLLLDFPALVEGREALLCWTEGEAELGWYHLVELGFAGRRPLPSETRRV
jgi:hypothetical protein